MVMANKYCVIHLTHVTTMSNSLLSLQDPTADAHVAVLGRNRTLFSLRISIALPRLKYCSAELPLRVGLIHAV